MARTDQEIVDQTEELAALLCSRFMGSRLDGVNFRDSMHPQLQQCWEVACEIQEMLTATDPENAVAELDGEEPSPIVKSAAEQIIDLIDGECRFWHGKDESRRGGYAILLATAKNIVKQEKERTNGNT